MLAILNDPTRVDNLSSAAAHAFLDARRTLRKSLDRRTRFIEALALHQQGSKLNGPMHGIVEYADAHNITMTCDGTRVLLETPTGHTVDLCTDHIAHFKYIITEACRYSLMDQLDKRVNGSTEGEGGSVKSKKRTRKDMKGISAMVDTRATLAIVNHKIKEKYEDDPSDRDTTDDAMQSTSEADKMLCRPCNLSRAADAGSRRS